MRGIALLLASSSLALLAALPSGRADPASPSGAGRWFASVPDAVVKAVDALRGQVERRRAVIDGGTVEFWLNESKTVKMIERARSGAVEYFLNEHGRLSFARTPLEAALERSDGLFTWFDQRRHELTLSEAERARRSERLARRAETLLAALPQAAPLGGELPLMRVRGHLTITRGQPALELCRSRQPIVLSDQTPGQDLVGLWDVARGAAAAADNLSVQLLVTGPWPEAGQLPGTVPPSLLRPGAQRVPVRAVERAATDHDLCEESLRDLEWRAAGSDPFWSLEVGPRGILFVMAATGSERSWRYAEPVVGGGRVYIRVTAEQPADVAADPASERLEVVFGRGPCADPLTGARYAYKAEVTLSGRVYLGCAIEGEGQEAAEQPIMVAGDSIAAFEADAPAVLEPGVLVETGNELPASLPASGGSLFRLPDFLSLPAFMGGEDPAPAGIRNRR